MSQLRFLVARRQPERRTSETPLPLRRLHGHAEPPRPIEEVAQPALIAT